MDTYAVIGLGTFGSAVAAELMNSGCEVLAIDHNEEKVQSAWSARPAMRSTKRRF